MVTYYAVNGHPPIQRWSLTNSRMVTHHQKEVYYRIEIWPLEQHQVKAAMDGHLLSLGLVPMNPRMVTHQKVAYYRVSKKKWDLFYYQYLRQIKNKLLDILYWILKVGSIAPP